MNGSAPSRSVPTSTGPASSVLAEGSVFAGRYRVVSTIAVGGMGAVYEVIHTETERRRALKVMHPHLFQSEEMRERFKREARIAAQIESEYIVDVSDAGVDEASRTPFIVMELLQGEDLGQRMKRLGRLPPGEVITYLQQVGLALDKTHARSIVHRDLKPDNVFLTTREDGSPRVKILDFGVAKLIAEEATSAGATRSLGTPLYMAPEQFRLGSQLQPAADIYALGMMAYTLLVGQPYWAGEAKISGDVIAFAMAVVLGPQESAVRRAAEAGVTLAPGFDPWFSKTTAPVPTDRYPSASEAVRALAFALGLSPGAPQPAAPAPSPAAAPAPSAAAAPSPAAPITGSAHGGLSTVLMGSSPLPMAAAAQIRLSYTPAQPAPPAPPAQPAPPPPSAQPLPQSASQGPAPEAMPPRARTVPLPPPPAPAATTGPQRGSWLPEQPGSPPPAPPRFQPPAAATGPQRGSWLPEQPSSPPAAPPAFQATGPQQAPWHPGPASTVAGAAVAVAAPVAAAPRERGRGPLIAFGAVVGAVLLAGAAWALLGTGGSANVATPADTSSGPTSSAPAAPAPPPETPSSSAPSEAPSSSAPAPSSATSTPSATPEAPPTAIPQASGARPSTSASPKPKPTGTSRVAPTGKPLLGRD